MTTTPLPFDPEDPGPFPDDEALADAPAIPPVRSLAALVPPTAAAAPAPSETLPPLPTVADFLPDLERERENPAAAGGVPLPAAWRCLRATVEGISRRDLEDAHGPRRFGNDDGAREADGRVQRRAEYGTHLPAGLHIVTGQTGGAKTAFGLNLARAVLAGGHPVLYVSLELDGVELAARLAGLAVADETPDDAEPAVTWWQLARRRGLAETGRQARRAAVAAVRSEAARLAVLAPDGALDPRIVRAHALALWRTHGCVPLVVFDYLQAAGIATADGLALPLRQHIAAVTMELRRLSREDRTTRMHEDNATAPTWPGCPVLVQSITARHSVRGADAVPGLDGKDPDALRHADLETLKALPKEAGEVEATAVTAWVLALGDVADAGPRPATLRLAKYRGGLAGQWIPFTFDGRTGAMAEAPARYALARANEAAAAEAAAKKTAERITKRTGGGRSGVDLDSIAATAHATRPR